MSAAEAASALPSLPKRLWQVFITPGDLFAALVREPAWFGALALGSVITAVSVGVLPDAVYMSTADQIVEGVRADGGEVPSFLSDPAALVGWLRIGSIVGALVFQPIFVVLLAGVLVLVFSVLLGDEGTYRGYLAVGAHSLLIPAVASLIVLTPLRIAEGDFQVDLTFGLFVEPFLEEGYLTRFFGLFRLFGLWGWVVLALGVAKLDRERSWGGALAIVLGLVVAVNALVAIPQR